VGSTLYADRGPPFGLAWILSQPVPAIRALCTGPYTGPSLISDGQRTMSVRRAVLYFWAPGCSPAFGITLTGRVVAISIDKTSDFSYTVVQMARSEYIGPFEQLVLGAILALQDEAYGVTIHAKVERLSRPRKISLGAIYVTLDRLEDKGLLSSRLSAPTRERGGRAKRCYRLEAAGERALHESAVIAERIWDSIAESRGRGWISDWRRAWGKQTG
jgi:DNA-binding PadR family transcriptional regulator